MKSIEKTGRSVEEAIQQALNDLGAERDAVAIEVLDEGSKGLFGLLGGRLARVQVSLKDEPAVTSEERPSVAEATEAGIVEDRVDNVELERAEAIQVACDFLEGVLTRLGLDVGIETREGDEQIVHMNITGEGVGLVIGRHGQTLDAIQYLTNVVANRNARSRVRVVIDAEGYRIRREGVLNNLAERMANQVITNGRKAVLEPMSALERRVIHLALENTDAVETYSEGEDPYRRVVIVPKEQ